MTTTRTKSDTKHLSMATQVASLSECRMKHGAVVVKNGNVLGISTNVVRNSPKNVDWKHSSIHAEVRALRKAGFPRRATVYVARVNKNGERRMSMPCAGCMSLIEELQCRVVWSV